MIMKELACRGVFVQVRYEYADGRQGLILEGEVCDVVEASEAFPYAKGGVSGIKFQGCIPSTHYPPPHPEFANIVFIDRSGNTATYIDENKQPRSVSLRRRPS
jgi:hypothetical protein